MGRFLSDLSGGIKDGGAAIRTARGHQGDVVGPAGLDAVAVQGDHFAGKSPHPEIDFFSGCGLMLVLVLVDDG